VVNLYNLRPLLIGHRGARSINRFGLFWSRAALPAENTVPAFEYALAEGCDGFEFDVRYTRDRRHILCHDPKMRRRVIAATDYWALHLRSERRRVAIACLEDVLHGFGDRAYLDIELKAAGCEEDIVAQLKAHPPARGYVVSSFLPDVLLRLNHLDESLTLGYICKDAEAAEEWSNLPISVVLPHYRLVSRKFIDEVHRRNMQLMAWTVNRKSDLLRLASWEIDGLISDDPRLLRQTFLLTERHKAAAQR
jgi:glycerophosphoryl diester phosphodiesterase